MKTIDQVVGVYDADSGIIGEVSYWFKARLGGPHCSLCDVTHGSVREKRAWRAACAELPVPFTTYHRNDQPPALRLAARDVVPLVAGRSGDDFVVLLGPDEIEACGGSPEALKAAVLTALEQATLA